jgi:hypothetical protein
MPERYIPGYFGFDYTAGFPVYSEAITVASGTTTGTFTFSSAINDLGYEVTFKITTANGVTAVTETSRSTTSVGFTVSPAPSGDAVITCTVSTIPADLKHAIGLKAALLPLDVAGDLIVGAGIASTSIGADGLHQSVNSTSSATNSGYGARVLQFERELKALLPALRAKYKMMGFGAV